MDLGIDDGALARTLAPRWRGASTIEFYASPARQVALLVFAGMSFALAAALALNRIPNMPADPAAMQSGYFGMAFFGFCAAVAIWRLWAQRGPLVTVSPAGLRDVRVAAEPIPWSAIRSISTAQMQRQTVLLVAIDPDAEKQLTITRTARWMREAHRRHGADGFVVSPHGLKVGFPTLFYTSRDFWEAWHKA
jgi:hypothetical protein